MPGPVGSGEIVRVYRSYLAGSRTTAEVSVHTGFTIKKSSAYTIALVDRGLLRRCGRAPSYESRPGNRHVWYEPTLDGREWKEVPR